MRKLLFIILICSATTALADTYDKLWQKASKAQAAAKAAQVRENVDKIYERAQQENNILQLTRVLYAYHTLNVRQSEAETVRNAKRVWEARRMERNSVQHVLLTHLLGRLTDNEYLLALSVADTTFLKEQKVSDHLPLVKGCNLLEVFGDYIRQRDMPDSVFVGWQRPQEETEDTITITKTETKTEETITEGTITEGTITKTETKTETKAEAKTEANAAEKPAPVQGPLPALTGTYSTYVFNVPGGMSRTCLVETKSGRPIKQWKMHRNDGRGQEQDFVADGNGHVWQRPSTIHNYDGIYDWSLQPVVEGSVNTLKATDFHEREGWNAGESNRKELWLDIQKEDRQRGLVSVTVRAPHRNLTLMRDITAGGRLIQQQQYQFSDFIHFDLQWREAYGSEALVTFAYVLNGHLYTASLTLSKPTK